MTTTWLARLTLIICLCSVELARATTFVAMSERTLARTADAIVVGTVTHVETVGGTDGAIHTLVTVQVESSHKGTVGDTVVLKQPGGDLEDRSLVIHGSPAFTRGERALLFLSAAGDGSARTTALGLGKFHVETTAAGTIVAERRVGEPVLGGSRRRRLKLARLLRTVAKAVASTTTAVRPLVAIPAEATAPGLERVEPSAFTFMDNPSGRWHEADLGETVVYGVDPKGDQTLGPEQSNAALDAALAAWTNVDGASINLARGTATELFPLFCDGLSQIIFNDPFNEMPAPAACGGVLALGGYCTKGRGGAQIDIVGGIRFRQIAEGNITFNRGFGGCSFWHQTNLAEIATHEIGHTIGIGHSSEEDDERSPALKDATMFWRAHFDGRGASLRADDVAAVRAIYPSTPVHNADDADADGVVDAVDNCPGDVPALGLANPGQNDTDGDGLGDLCDACPLAPGDDAVCGPISASWLRVVDTNPQGVVLWRGHFDLPVDADVASARIVLTAGAGVLVDTATPATTRPARRGRGRLVYRGDTALVSLRRTRGGTYAIRAIVRNVALGTATMPVVSASLQIGSSTFATTLSCPPRGGRRFTCLG